MAIVPRLPPGPVAGGRSVVRREVASAMKIPLGAVPALAAMSALLAPAVARAGMPPVNASCPGGIEVHADAGGPVYVNGHEARLKKFSETYFEATDASSGVTISLMTAPDGTPSVSYTGRRRVHGVCKVAAAAPAEEASMRPGHAAPAAASLAEAACLAAVAGTVGLKASALTTIGLRPSPAGVGVMVRVPGAAAPWSCQADRAGHVQSVSYTGSEGRL
jgi:hypothetical protein